MKPAALKLELLADLRKDITDIFKSELRAALGEDLSTIKSELQVVKTQLSTDRAATHAELDALKSTIEEMQQALSGCTDDIAALQKENQSFKAELAKLDDKQEDLPTALKLELLADLRKDITNIFKSELRAALGEDLSTIKSELQVVKTQLSTDRAATHAELDALKSTMEEMQQALSGCTDDIATLQKENQSLKAELAKLDDKQEDLESRSRWNNIRIVGIPEEAGSSAQFVSMLLKDALHLDKAPLLDRCHRSSQPKPRPGEQPRVIIARLHYYTDCINIQRRARESGRMTYKDMSLSVFPDYTSKVGQARAGGSEICLLHPARLRISHNGEHKVFLSPREAQTFINKLNVVKN
ncbi:hypothetical protein ABVT39_005465 [Epinephelus coioides]